MVCGYCIETICNIESQYVVDGGRVGNPLNDGRKKSVEPNDIIVTVLPKERFVNICQWAVEACLQGTRVKTNSNASMSNFDLSGNFLKADDVNYLLSLLDSLSVNISRVSAGQVVKADTFNKIFNGILNNAKYSSSACDSCNVCEVTQCNNTTSGGGGGSSGGGSSGGGSPGGGSPGGGGSSSSIQTATTGGNWSKGGTTVSVHPDGTTVTVKWKDGKVTDRTETKNGKTVSPPKGKITT